MMTLLMHVMAPLGFAAAGGGGEGEGFNAADLLLKVTPGLWIWTLIIFGGLMFLLWRKGFGALIAMLDRRDLATRGAIDEAKAERVEAQKLLEEHKALLDKTRRETADMLSEAQNQAKTERQRIVGAAREEADKLLVRSREQIEQETRAAQAELRKTTADLAVEVARKLVPRSLDDASHRSLAEQFVSELERGPQA